MTIPTTSFDARWLAQQRERPGRVLAEHGGPASGLPASGPSWTYADVRSEEDEQRGVIAWRDEHRDERPVLRLLIHVPNGGARTAAEAGVLKATGVVAGIPDLLLLAPRGRFCGLAVEMKGADSRGRLGDLSDDQARALSRLQAEGWAVDVCWTAAQGIATVTHYLDDPDAFVGGL